MYLSTLKSFGIIDPRVCRSFPFSDSSFHDKPNCRFPEEDPPMNERTTTLRTVALGIAAMFAVYWIYSLQIAPRLPIGDSARSLTALLSL